MSRIPFWEAHRLLSIDAVHQPIPVRPTVHYSMGGIPVNTNGQVRSGPNDLIDGFFAAGESACVSVHGANRLVVIPCWSVLFMDVKLGFT